MAKIFLSFLGTNKYYPCNYLSPGKKTVMNVRYVQEATIQQNCENFDRYIFFLTKESKNVNWQDDGYIDKNGSKIKNQGLKTRLELLGLKEKVEEEIIKEGFTENEIWEIFQKIYDKVEKNDQIVFDITHAFRFLPMLGMVLINYLKATKDVELLGIYYGAFEALGPGYKVEKIPIEKRNVNILDLISLSLLQDWTFAANAVSQFGNPEKMSELTKKQLTPILSETKGKDKAAANLRNLVESISKITDNITSCRGPKIFKDNSYENVNNCLDQMKGDYIPPLIPIITSLQDNLKNLSSDKGASNAFQLVGWCIRYDWIQQGYTILFESIITLMLDNLGEPNDDLTKRSVASACFAISYNNTPHDEWLNLPAKHPELTKKYLESEIVKLLDKEITQLQDLRNDINHAGFKPNRTKSNTLKNELNNIYNVIIEKLEIHKLC